MSTRIEDNTRRQIAAFLPDAIAKAMTSYQEFQKDDVEGEKKDAKSFKAHHDACKVAIAHLELLIELARWADLPGEDALANNDQKMLEAIMDAAQEELEKYGKNQGSAGGPE